MPITPSTYQPIIIKPVPDWTDDERPVIPGSPSTPEHPLPIRFAYGAVGLLIGTTSGLGISLINLNMPSIQGDMGLTPVQSAYFPAIYAIGNSCANLVIYKFRQQFGIRLFAEILMGLYVILALLHLLVNDFGTALLVRGISGLAGAATAALGFFYMIQAFNKKHRAKGLIIGLGLQQLATPIAGMISPFWTDSGQWHIMYQFEAGLAICCLAAVVILKLPPSIHIKAFEKQDIPTVILIILGMSLLFTALSQGVIQWWTNAPWIGLALAGSFICLTVAMFYEYHRLNPLIHIRWLILPGTLNFAMGALALRFLISEQSYGAVSMLKYLGMGADQLRIFYVIVFFGVLTGIICSAIFFHPKTILLQILAALALIAGASLMDANSTSLTRPHDMFLSQFMMAIAGGLFIGPMMLIGIMQVFRKGKQYIISFAILFSFTQNFAGIAGPAFFGSYQFVKEHEYSSRLVSNIEKNNLLLKLRQQKEDEPYQQISTDPALQRAYGTAHLAQVVRKEANIRAYNDVFLLVGVIAISFLLWSLISIYRSFSLALDQIKITKIRRKLILNVYKKYKRYTRYNARHRG